ncbi:MAG: hypothetical protein R3321_02275 [Nitrososphaeraceae archaeon]|nr:hypothetical protein [Nitrososphaeraceae archaeon]
MKYKTISYKQTRNLGNFESRTIEILAELEEEDNIDVKLVALKRKVFQYLYPEEGLNINLVEEDLNIINESATEKKGKTDYKVDKKVREELANKVYKDKPKFITEQNELEKESNNYDKIPY